MRWRRRDARAAAPVRSAPFTGPPAGAAPARAPAPPAGSADRTGPGATGPATAGPPPAPAQTAPPPAAPGSPVPPGQVRLGDLRRTTPLSRVWGFDRGTPVDRIYMERFLEGHRSDIRGSVLEVGDAAYTHRYGGDQVSSSDVLHVVEGTDGATVIADLADADHLPADRWDCVIMTQTLQYIYEPRRALATLWRILRPGGVLLATFPGIAQVDAESVEYQMYWTFTPHSARRLFHEHFRPEGTTVTPYGNVLVATALLYGLAAEELNPADFDAPDPTYAVTVAVRAVKESVPTL